MKVSIFLISFFFLIITSCSSKNVVIIPSQSSINSQEEKLRNIKIGMTYKEVSSIIQLNDYFSFEVVELDVSYLLKNYRNTETNISLSLFFKDDKLVSVISSDISQTLFSCRTPFRTAGKHWLSLGISPYSNWIIERNILDENFDYRLHNVIQKSEKSESQQNFETATTVMAYSPFIIIGSPFILYSWATGETDKNNKEQEKQQFQRKYAEQVKLGTSLEDLTANLGNASRIDDVNNNLSLSYNNVYHTYGINNDKVVWKESISMFELFHRQKNYGESFYGDADCGSLDRLWIQQKDQQ